jgi:hypothetical protein
VTHRFKSTLVETDDLFQKFVFTFEEGEYNEGLMNVVFDEYINNPILRTMNNGFSLIPVGDSPLITNTASSEVTRHKKKIEYKLLSQLFKNRFVPAEEIGKDKKVLYMELHDGTAVRLKNASTKTIGQIMYLLVISQILDGMVIEVDVNEYIPSCENCVFKCENFKLYRGVLEEEARSFFIERIDCIINLDFKDCKFFIRNTNPDLADMETVLRDVYELEGSGDDSLEL